MGRSTALKHGTSANSKSLNAYNATPFAKVNMHEFSVCGDTARDEIKTRKMTAAKCINWRTTIYRCGNMNKRALIGD